MNSMSKFILVTSMFLTAACQSADSGLTGYQDTPEQWTCKELAAELANKQTEKSNQERRIASECSRAPLPEASEENISGESQQAPASETEKNESAPGKAKGSGKVVDASVSSGAKKASLGLQGGVTYNSEAERSRVCEGNRSHAANLGNYVTRLQGIYDRKDCQNAVPDTRAIYDRAECLEACSGSRCFTCRYEGSGIGAGFASCSSEADAHQAAMRVCTDLGGQRCRIDSCYAANSISGNRPSVVGDKEDVATTGSWSETTTVSAGFEAPKFGVDTSMQVEAQFRVEGSFSVSVAGGRDSLGTGIREGQTVGDDSPDATWTCSGSGKITGVAGVTAGFSIVGNGISTAVAFERSQQTGLTHGPFRAAGLALSYMESECRSWARNVALPDLVRRQLQLFKVDQPVYSDCKQDRSIIGCPCDPSVASSCSSSVIYPPETPVMCTQSPKGYYACERVFAKGQGNCLRSEFRFRCAPGSSCVETQPAGYFSEAVGICQ